MEKLLKKIKNNKLKLLFIFFAICHFCITFYTDKFIFDFDNLNYFNYYNCKVVLLGILIFVYLFLYKLVKKDRNAIKYAKYFLIYMIPILILLLLVWPGNWQAGDVQNFYNAAIKSEYLYWLRYISSVFYIVSFMLIPIPSGVCIIQAILFGVTISYFVKNVRDVCNTKWVYLIYLPFFLCHTLFYVFFPNRPIMFGITYLLLISILIIDKIKKNKITKKKFLALLLLTAIVAYWRTEAIYLIIAVPLFIFIIYKIKVNIKNIVGILLIFIISFSIVAIPQKYYENSISGYSTNRNLPIVVTTLSYMFTYELSGSNLEENLSKIDKILDVNLVKEYPSYEGAQCYYHGDCVRDYTDEEYNEFILAYFNIIKDNFLPFLKTNIKKFLVATSIYGDNFHARDLYSSNEDMLFNKESTQTIFGYTLRSKIYSIFEGKYTTEEASLWYRVTQNLLIPLVLICILFIISIFKKNLFGFLLTGMLIGHTLIVFFTSSASYFMYYFNVFISGWVLFMIYIVKLIYNHKNTKSELAVSKKNEYKMSKPDYKFSIIMPIYNVEDYVEETVKSVINQSIGFRDNIEIILVNDGSPDNSEEICLKYRDLYPDNIKYIKQKNQGVSSARNKGLTLATGKYVNFLDSDDLWSRDAFEKVYNFFEEHYNDIDLVACRVKFFEGRKGFVHPLDYKFREHKNQIIDIETVFDAPQLSVTSAFIKREALSKYKFDTRLKYAEDALLCTQIILEKEKYAILDVVYNYRRRISNNSALQSSINDKSYYINTIKYGFRKQIQISLNKYGKVIPYVQFLIMYDFQWRIRTKISGVLTFEEKEEYLNDIKDVLKYIDDKIILLVRNINVFVKLYTIKEKYNDNAYKTNLSLQENKIFYNNIECFDFFKDEAVILRILEIQNNILTLEGVLNIPLPANKYKIYFEDNNRNKTKAKIIKAEALKTEGIFGEINTPLAFFAEITLDDLTSLNAVMEFKDYKIKPKITFAGLSKLNNNKNYYAKTKYILNYDDSSNKILVKNNSFLNHLQSEIKYLINLLKMHKIPHIIYRLLYFLCAIFKRRELWIISDRSISGGDSGEVLFEYLVKNEKDAKVYFVINKNSCDYERIKKIGNVLSTNSLKYKIKFLLSDKIISSHADDYVINPFGTQRKFYIDLYNFDFIFLQHGIIQEDLASWLNKFNKNMSIFVTTSEAEYKSVLKGNYLYDESVVKITGLPRYDKLKSSKQEKKIIIMPTWRQNIAGANDLGERKYNEHFKDSDYFKFYNKLINDKDLLNVMKEKGYAGEFFLHPAHINQAIDFKGNDTIKIHEGLTNYSEEFKKSSLLITDYSSVHFDFAYLKKPVIYTLFDNDTFYQGHIYSHGYFDKEQDGFGPVCYDYESTVKAIINAIENDCVNDKKYLDRVNKFFKYTDTNNCKRVYEEIKKL